MTEPEKVFRKGCCSASIFSNNIEKNGKTLSIKKVVIQRSYKDRNSQWQNTTNFGVNELPKLILAATKAYDYLTSLERE